MGWTIRLCGPVGLDQDGQSRAAALPGTAGAAALRLPRPQPRPRLRPGRADRPAVARAAARRGRHARSARCSRSCAARSATARSPAGRSCASCRRAPIEVDVEIAAAAAAEAEAAIDAHDWAGASAAARDVLATDLQTFLPDCDGPWVAECRRELETVRVRALEVLAEAGLRQGGRELGDRRAGRSRRGRRRAVPRVGAPAADGGPRGGGQPGRGAARVRGAAHPAARRARHHARARPRWPSTSGCCAARRPPPGRPSRAPTRSPRSPGRRRSPPRSSRHALVGRARELDVLEEHWDEAVAGARQLVLLAGDAGIGKTRLAAELGRRARDDGALVLYGRFDEETLAPYQPVVEMVRGWSSGASLEPLRERLGVRAAELGILFGELGPPPRRCSRRRPDARRAALLRRGGGAARPRPARGRRSCSSSTTCTGPTARRCSSCGTSCARRSRGRALLLGTYREAELEPGHALHELIGDVRREGMLKHARARRPGRAGGGRAGRRARRAGRRARVRARPARRDRGQPVLHRGGRPPPARERPRAAGRHLARPRRACPTACARSPRGACGGSTRSRARRSRSRR